MLLFVSVGADQGQPVLNHPQNFVCDEEFDWKEIVNMLSRIKVA